MSHQWFYGLVGNDQVSEPWLDEALAQYSSYLYYERYLPGDKEWWWDTEIRQYAPAGKIDLLIYQFRNNRDYMNSIYRRGAEFVRDLRETMGDPAFSGLPERVCAALRLPVGQVARLFHRRPGVHDRRLDAAARSLLPAEDRAVTRASSEVATPGREPLSLPTRGLAPWAVGSPR